MRFLEGNPLTAVSLPAATALSPLRLFQTATAVICQNSSFLVTDPNDRISAIRDLMASKVPITLPSTLCPKSPRIPAGSSPCVCLVWNFFVTVLITKNRIQKPTLFWACFTHSPIRRIERGVSSRDRHNNDETPIHTGFIFS